MRSIICQVLIFSVLCTSVESAADMLVDGYPHGDDAAHQEEFGHQLDAHEDGSSNSELDGDHCDHCCHGHTASITTPVRSMKTPLDARDYRAGRSRHVRNLAQAPPTPPPNA